MEKNDLKFRVWNGSEMEHNIMVGKFGIFYVNPSNNGIDENDTASLSPFNTRYPDDIPLMQFTGLKDVNGKDIYEGDICEWNGWGKNISKVEFKNGAFSLSSKYGGKGQPIGERYKWQDMGASGEEELKLKVIGNIYENPNGLE